MSGIQMKTELTDNEKKAIQQQATLYPEHTGRIVHHDQMNPKLLLCILETLQDMKQEIATLRKSNQDMKEILTKVTGSVSGVNGLNVHNLNL
jgi:hypothetical protein